MVTTSDSADSFQPRQWLIRSFAEVGFDPGEPVIMPLPKVIQSATH